MQPISGFADIGSRELMSQRYFWWPLDRLPQIVCRQLYSKLFSNYEKRQLSCLVGFVHSMSKIFRGPRPRVWTPFLLKDNQANKFYGWCVSDLDVIKKSLRLLKLQKVKTISVVHEEKVQINCFAIAGPKTLEWRQPNLLPQRAKVCFDQKIRKSSFIWRHRF